MNVGEFLQQCLSQCKSASPELDVQILLAHVIERPRAWIAAHLDAPLTQPQIDSALQAFARLKAGEPLPYILGHWEFYGLDFNVNPHVLIPRPETELLVENAIKWLAAHPKKRSVADIGTGSGIIAITIARHVQDVHILATDISADALHVAKSNAEKHGVQNRIEFVVCDLLPENPPAFDLVCANLPYIPTQTMKQLPIYGREPTLALDGGADGLDLYRRLWKMNLLRQKSDGLLLCEIESTHGAKAMRLAREKFPHDAVSLLQDLAGLDRFVQITTLPTRV